MDDARRLEQLREEIRRHNRLYYNQASSQISDRQYDLLMEELRRLEQLHPELATPDSPTQRVGGRPSEGFVTVEHATPMLSIDNTYNREELRQFDQRVRKALTDRPYHYLVDPKIDGVALSLRYEGGALVLAATRGDGLRGDDVTANVRTIKSVPRSLRGSGWPDVLEVRGEVYWPREAFAQWNARRTRDGQPTFANPRNGAAGSLKLLDPALVAQRNLAFAAHGLGTMSPLPAARASAVMELLEQWGIPVNPYQKICAEMRDVYRAVEEWLDRRDQAPYETDGMVVKIDELDLREELGQTSKYPRWCIAYKYEAQRERTVLREVSFQVGRLGTITPVAHFDPVQLSGTIVSNASLHNFDQVRRLDVRIGDTITVEKSGEIIPQIVQVDFARRPQQADPIRVPDACPVCNGPVRRDEGGVYLRCVSPSCPAQLRERIRFFAGRDQMDIENLGPAVIDRLVEVGLVQQFADLYRLGREGLMGLEMGRHVNEKGTEVVHRLREKSADNIVSAIQASKARGLRKVLASIGIPGIGDYWAGVLAERFGSAEALMEASLEDLREIFQKQYPVTPRDIHAALQEPGRQTSLKLLADEPVTPGALRRLKLPRVGPKFEKMLSGRFASFADLAAASRDEIARALEIGIPDWRIAESVYRFLQSPSGRHTLKSLREVGVHLTSARAQGEEGGAKPLAGKTVVVTGTLETFSRKQAQQAIEQAGGKAVSSVSKSTDFVVVGASAGSKAAKASELGIETIDEAEFRRRLRWADANADGTRRRGPGAGGSEKGSLF